MIRSVLTYWFGNFSQEEFKKFLFLGAIFCFTIAINWLLRTLKDSAFITTTGSNYIPHAKWISFIVSIGLVNIYGKLVDIFPRHRLFYVLSTLYAAGALIFAYFLSHTEYGVCNINSDPCRLLGWFWYMFVESYGSIMVTLFWAFVADTTTPDSAKRGYLLIAFFGQLGNILGPLLVQQQAQAIGTGWLVVIASGLIFLVIPLMHLFLITIDHANLAGFQVKNEAQIQKNEAKANFIQGLGILVSKPYLLGILGIVAFYEVIYSIFDYRFKALAAFLYSGEELAQYFGQFGVVTGIVSLICLICGAQTISRWTSLTISLVLSPIIMGILSLCNYWDNISVILWVMVLANVLNYVLHQQTKEQLYIPTGHDVKYKTKAWIEIFGYRGAKALGSGINVLSTFFTTGFILFTTSIGLGLSISWLLTAVYVGKKHSHAVAHKKLVC